VNKLIKVFLSAFMTVAVVFSVNAAMDEDSIRDRLKPVGKVCVEGDDCGTATAAAASGPRSGEEIFNASCTACHSTGAMGAPKFGDAAAWADRSAKGVDALIANAINGINTMPPRGTCASCSDDEIAETVKYILANSK
jgi:cytochrome c5